MPQTMESDLARTDVEPPRPKRSRKSLFLGGGLAALVATGYALSLIAAPDLRVDVAFQGPFVVDLSDTEIQVNLAKDGGKRFLSMALKAEVHSYSPAYSAERVADPLYQATLKDVLINVSTQKSKEEIETPIGKEIFKQELREAVDPILFPVHVGNERSPYEGHERSGLRPGESCRRASYRGPYLEGVLAIDQPRGTLSLDGGPPVVFTGGEQDLRVEDPEGRFVHVDVTGLREGFVGEVHVGTFGCVKGILFDSIIVQ